MLGHGAATMLRHRRQLWDWHNFWTDINFGPTGDWKVRHVIYLLLLREENQQKIIRKFLFINSRRIITNLRAYCFRRLETSAPMALAIGERYAERRELKPRVFRWLVWKKICSYLRWFIIHWRHLSWLSAKRQCALVGVMSQTLGAEISFQAAQIDVGEQVSSLYPHEQNTGTLSLRAKLTTSKYCSVLTACSWGMSMRPSL